ncbi:putative transcription factor [Pseudozyma hubeiensis SY62]|uniref:Putative transcription factor n=1 Tax=Pseudozyma hubeiensis (strain SY62) TaxID=1305764 RepID=R9P6S0_PSEHS|nr:putative transcription factor [Pseudozyma hubeiensis SY62]GAC97103.1 putative transcription factor [Pseudozyma hubeiensis SY62]
MRLRCGAVRCDEKMDPDSSADSGDESGESDALLSLPASLFPVGRFLREFPTLVILSLFHSPSSAAQEPRSEGKAVPGILSGWTLC